MVGGWFIAAGVRGQSIALPFEPLAEHLAVAPDRLCPLTDAAFRRLFVGSAPFHFPKSTLALHLFLEHPQSGVDVVVAHEHLHDCTPLLRLFGSALRPRRKEAARIGFPRSPA